MIDILVRVTVLLVLVAMTAYLLRRRSAALRHLVWSLAIVGLVALPVLTTLLPPPFRLHVLPAAPPRLADSLIGDSASVLASLTSTAQSARRQAAGSATDASSVTATTVAMPGDMQASEDDPAAVRKRVSATTVLLAIWIAGALALLLRFVVGLVIVGRIARRARPVTDERWHTMADRAARALGVEAPVDLRFSDEAALPFACGLLSPVIVLPSSADSWNQNRREAVLMHEFAHISRGDLAMNTLSHLTRALYWPHPLAWLATHKLRVEGERASDDAVLRAGTVPSDYAEHLLNIVKTVSGTRAVPTVALAMARKSEFEGRLLAILEPGIPRSRLTRWRLAAIAVAFVTVVMPLAAMSPVRPSEPAPIPTAEPGAVLLQVPTQSPSASPTPERATPPAVQATGAIGALIETLGDANAQVRLAAAKSLGQLGDPRAIAALAKALREDTDARVREAAAYALGEIDDTRAVPPLLEALKTEKVASVREKIVHSLGEIDDPAAVPGIVAVLKDPSVPVRRAAVHALGELEDPSAVPALIGMVKDGDAEVRQYAAHAIGDLKGASTATAIDALAPLVRDPNADVRQQAVSSLGNLEDMRALAPLVAALKDANPDVRSQAAEAMDNIDDLKQAPPALIEALLDPNREVRKNAAESLGSIGDDAAVPALKRLTADNDAEVRRSAAEALSEIGGPEAIQVLMGLLKDQDPEIRRIAAEALGSKRH